MNLIDTNAVTYIFQSGVQCKEIYYMAPEIIEETEITEAIFNQKVSQNLIHISKHELYDECLYIDFYKQMLNKHHGKSFFNMTGFGDISILAVIHTAFKVLANQKQKRLFDFPESINVFTNDEKLERRIYAEFSNDVLCKKIDYLQ